MDDASPIHEYITDVEFKQAVALLDSGNASELELHLSRHPRIVSDSARFSETDFVGGTQEGQYFEQPKLLWFVAENPIRNGALPGNITEIAQVIIDREREVAPNNLQTDLDYTLALVTSGNIPRHSGHQSDLVGVLVKNGADPDCADAALAHGEREAVQVLLDKGAKVDLLIAAGMGLHDELSRLAATSDSETKQKALSCAANCRQPESCRLLIEAGANPNKYNPNGFHAHCTALHSAISVGTLETVEVLLSGGADPGIKDTMFDGDALGWANHMGRDEIKLVIEKHLENS